MFHFLDFGVSLYCFQVVLTLGYAASLVSLMYVVAFIFRKRRKNSGLWSFCFYVVSIYTNSSFSNFQCNIKHSCVCLEQWGQSRP